MNSIQEALRELRAETLVEDLQGNTASTVVESYEMQLVEAKKSRHENTLRDLWDQVYCSLTDGGYNNTYAALGDLNGKGKYDVALVGGSDVRPGFDTIVVNSPETDAAEEVAKIYGLEYRIVPGKRIYIYVPQDAPVNTDLLTPAWRDAFVNNTKAPTGSEENIDEAIESSEEAIVEVDPKVFSYPEFFADEVEELGEEEGTVANYYVSKNTSRDDLIVKKYFILNPKNLVDDEGNPWDISIEEFVEEGYAEDFGFQIANGDYLYTRSCHDIGAAYVKCKDYNSMCEYIRNGYENEHWNADDLIEESLNEDVVSSMPVSILPHDEVYSYIENVPEATADRPPFFFPVGYIKELGSEIPSKFRGGRGSEGNPKVRIFKCSEMTVYTGADYENLKATKAYRKETGKERSGERTGFSFGGDTAIVDRIGISARGEEQLQCYVRKGTKPRVKYFISLDDEDLREASRQEVAEYLTPAQANKVLGNVEVADGPEGAKVVRLKLSGIYRIGNLGQSVM